MTDRTLLFALISLSNFVAAICSFALPVVIIEPLSPRGYQASIPERPGIKLFAFHGKLNELLRDRDGVVFNRNIDEPKNGRWRYTDLTTQLRPGDSLYYRMYVDYVDGGRKLGYVSPVQVYRYEGGKADAEITYPTSLTTINGVPQGSTGEVVFEDTFTNLDTNKWSVEQYIPLRGPSFEFNSYENSPDLVRVKDGRLEIRPHLRAHNLQDLKSSLDLRQGCTSNYPEECVTYPKGAFLNPPVRSGRITSKISFKYGRIEVRGRLPSGDWIFPEVTLIPKDRSKRERKIWIAYSRGNRELLGNGGIDIGGKLLFCGPIASSSEPIRSTYLRTKLDEVPFSEETHTYELSWEPRQITCSVDGQYFGRVDTSDFEGFDSEFQISLGVGIGGINDFPDDFKSGGREKPWKNKNIKQVKTFFEAKNAWLSTWQEEKATLKVDWVKLYAI